MNFLRTISAALRDVPRILAESRAIRRELRHLRRRIGLIEARQLDAQPAPEALQAAEFTAYSQWGEDGILRHLLRHTPIARKIFVEFGVEDYTEANTRFLLETAGWSGLVLDGSETNIRRIRRDEISWRYHLKAAHAFITRENIDELLRDHGLTGEIGLLSVDIDGVDYWVWEAITVVQPAIVVAEYNSLFGPDRAVTVPYDPQFQRSRAHFSHSYYGASIAALTRLGNRKDFALVGSNSAGNNAFFVRRDLLRAPLREVSAAEAWVRRSFREARDPDGKLMLPTFEEEAALIAGLPLVEVEK